MELLRVKTRGKLGKRKNHRSIQNFVEYEDCDVCKNRNDWPELLFIQNRCKACKVFRKKEDGLSKN